MGKTWKEGDVLKGNFYIISNQGEYYLPFVVSIEHVVLDSSIGTIKNLFHFANLAKEQLAGGGGTFLLRGILPGISGE